MLASKDTGLISPEDYLKGEPLSDVKHELIDGHVYAMAGPAPIMREYRETYTGNLAII